MDSKKTIEKNNFPMTYHKVLYVLEGLLVFRDIMNIATAMIAGQSSVYRTVDIIFYVAMIVANLIAIVRHDYKVGAIAFYTFLVLELSLNILVFVLAIVQGLDISEMTTTIISLTIGSVIWFVCTFIYYKKSWSILK